MELVERESQSVAARLAISELVYRLESEGVTPQILLSELLRFASSLAPSCQLSYSHEEEDYLVEIENDLNAEKELKASSEYKEIKSLSNKIDLRQSNKKYRDLFDLFDKFFGIFRSYLAVAKSIYPNINADEAFEAIAVLPYVDEFMELCAISQNMELLKRCIEYIDALKGLDYRGWQSQDARTLKIEDLEKKARNARLIFSHLKNNGEIEQRKIYKAVGISGTSGRFLIYKAENLELILRRFDSGKDYIKLSAEGAKLIES